MARRWRARRVDWRCGWRTKGARGTPVAIHAPNSAAWVAAALGIMAAGGVLLPLDDLTDTVLVLPVLKSGGVRLVFTVRRHLATGGDALREAGIRAILLEAAGPAAPGPPCWERLRSARRGDAAEPAAEDPAALLATSGTTGRPKTFFLTHRNIGCNVVALRDLGLVGPGDRILLPLPLHHAYPLVVGMLTTLSAGSVLILPTCVTGAAIMRAARDGAATVIVAVPRLYEALATTISARIAARGAPVRLALQGALRLCAAIRRATGASPGRVLFTRLRGAVSPSLRLLISGGARLELQTAETLKALGWTVLSGYGLAETASVFTGNRPQDRRLASAGLPLGDGRIRIAEPDADGTGEIQLRGSAVTSGYLDNPDANRDGFTADGWLRSGDLGHLDADGFLYVTGRTKEVLVLGGGKKVNPEDLERLSGAAPQLQEIAVLEQDGALVALVRPDHAKLHEMGSTNIRDGVRVVLAECEGPALASSAVRVRADGRTAAAHASRQVPPLHAA